MLPTLMGHTAHSVHDGQEAVAAAAGFRPDVVLCDLDMPKLNGDEACRQMKAQAWRERVIFIALKAPMLEVCGLRWRSVCDTCPRLVPVRRAVFRAGQASHSAGHQRAVERPAFNEPAASC
jgi:CheY-like chemotaxis protein